MKQIIKLISIFLTNYIQLASGAERQYEKFVKINCVCICIQGTTPAAYERRKSEAAIRENTPEANFDSSGPEDDDLNDEEKAARVKRRLVREVKFLKGKLDRLKIKEHTAKNERQAIRVSMKKNQLVLR